MPDCKKHVNDHQNPRPQTRSPAILCRMQYALFRLGFVLRRTSCLSLGLFAVIPAWNHAAQPASPQSNLPALEASPHHAARSVSATPSPRIAAPSVVTTGNCPLVAQGGHAALCVTKDASNNPILTWNSAASPDITVTLATMTCPPKRGPEIMGVSGDNSPPKETRRCARADLRRSR